MEHDDHCYYLSMMPSNWTCAEEYCRSGGAHLASVTSVATNEFILSELSKKGCTTLWIGGTDKDVEGKWTWSDCSAWDYDSGWRLDQTNEDEKEDCLEMYYKEVNPAGTLTDQTGVLGQGIH